MDVSLEDGKLVFDKERMVDFLEPGPNDLFLEAWDKREEESRLRGRSDPVTVHLAPLLSVQVEPGDRQEIPEESLELKVHVRGRTDVRRVLVENLLAIPRGGGDWSMQLKLRIKTVPLKQWEVGRQLRRRIRIALNRAGIPVPFPALGATSQPARPPMEPTDAAEA